MGAILVINGQVKAWFAIPCSELDEQYLEFAVGTASAQQVGETLCGLVAIKQWLAEWQQLRLQFIINGDNLGTLAL